jgi:hypothetical protein
MSEDARYGWGAGFPEFRNTSARVIRARLQDFVRDVGVEQIAVWDYSIPVLQKEVGEVLDCDSHAPKYTAILEYELPMESRRPDVVFLVRGAVVVLELKGKAEASQADIDQAAAYARDLRCYHRECAERQVLAVLVPTKAQGFVGESSGVRIVGPDAVDQVVEELVKNTEQAPVEAGRFLAESAYRPLPTLVRAARLLCTAENVPKIFRAYSATEPAIEVIAQIIHEAARTRTRRLVLLTGVPGAGKTLVGLKTVHAHYLDDLAITRPDGHPTTPAVFLSGNGPLVQVLQYELRSVGGGGKTFVRDVKNYVKRYSAGKKHVPPEHVLVFDEAQRAFDARKASKTHKQVFDPATSKSEPEHFIEFAERVPEWCVVIGLVGSGQEIHEGEEAGLIQWRHAVERAGRPQDWQVHGPERAAPVFAGSDVKYSTRRELSLDTAIRQHCVSRLPEYVEGILSTREASSLAAQAAALDADGYNLRITRELPIAKRYLRDRYADNPMARFGLVASSRDKDLASFGIPNDWNSTKIIRFGPWYADDESEPTRRSCRHLETCVTEFGCQGLELDAALLAWGTDLQLRHGRWSNHKARRYAPDSDVRDKFQLRLNAYRVLLTRGRDATVTFVPPLPELDETFEYLCASGWTELKRS